MGVEAAEEGDHPSIPAAVTQALDLAPRAVEHP